MDWVRACVSSVAGAGENQQQGGDCSWQWDNNGYYPLYPPNSPYWYCIIYGGNFCVGFPGYGDNGGGGASSNDSSDSGGGGLGDTICSLIPSGRVRGASGATGILGGLEGGGEIVVNYDTGQTSAFAFGGVHAGVNGALSGTIYTGFAYGLQGDNSNYSQGFTGFQSSLGLVGDVAIFANSSAKGGFVKGAPGVVPDFQVTVYGAGVSANLMDLPYTGNANTTYYSNPQQIGRFTGFGLLDYVFYGARRICNSIKPKS